jgi:hypothetical protein
MLPFREIASFLVDSLMCLVGKWQDASTSWLIGSRAA